MADKASMFRRLSTSVYELPSPGTLFPRTLWERAFRRDLARAPTFEWRSCASRMAERVRGSFLDAASPLTPHRGASACSPTRGERELVALSEPRPRWHGELPFARIVRRFTGDGHVVHVALAQRGRRDADELGAGGELCEVARAG